MQYRITSSETFEAEGIAYDTAAIYAVGAINDPLFQDIQQMCQRKEFASRPWHPAPRLIHITGPNGKQVIRFAQIDSSGIYLRFYAKPKQPVYSSLALLKATAHDPLDYIRQHLASPVIHASKPSKNSQKGTGILIGDVDSYISSLLIVESDRVRTMDVQPQERGSGREFTIVKPADATATASTRADFNRIIESSHIVPDHVFNNNTQLTLSPN